MRELVIRINDSNKIEYYVHKVNEKTLQIREYVFLEKGKKSEKFANHYSGPHKVHDILGNENVEKQYSEKKIKIVHANRLRKSYVELDEN